MLEADIPEPNCSPPPLPQSFPQRMNQPDEYIPCERLLPQPHPHPLISSSIGSKTNRFLKVYGKENKKVRFPMKSIDPQFQNPHRVAALANRNTISTSSVKNSLAKPTSNSIAHLETKIQQLQTSKLNHQPLKEEIAKEAAKVVNCSPNHKKYRNLIDMDVEVPMKQRLIPKQIDSKWRKTLSWRPDIKRKNAIEPIVLLQNEEDLFKLLK